MKGLKIIPMFLVLILCSFVGALFVEANRDPVQINFFRYQTPPTKLGLVVLVSMLSGMIVTGLLCSVELLALFMQNQRLKRKLNAIKTAPAVKPPQSIFRPAPTESRLEPQEKTDSSIKIPSDPDPSENTGSFNPL